MFPPYTKPQLRDIIDDRVARAASKGTDGIFTAVAVGSIAAFAVKHTGARTAMRVCTRAVLECEFRNLSNIRWRSEGPVSPMNCSDVTLAAQFVTILIDKPDSFSDLQDDHLADLPKRFPVQEKKESET